MTPDQHRRILAALENERRPGQTPAAKLLQALRHARNSEIKTPAGRPGRDVALTSSKTTEGRCCDES